MANTDYDKLAQTLGLKKIEARYGYAVASATVKNEHLNGVDIAHGGFMFSLADYTAALATNTDDKIAISSAASIDFLAPTPEGATVIATATIAAEDRKSAVCSVILTVGGKTAAVFHSRVIFKQPVK